MGNQITLHQKDVDFIDRDKKIITFLETKFGDTPLQTMDIESIRTRFPFQNVDIEIDMTESRSRASIRVQFTENYFICVAFYFEKNPDGFWIRIKP